jgi:hypothetical protein
MIDRRTFVTTAAASVALYGGPAGGAMADAAPVAPMGGVIPNGYLPLSPETSARLDVLSRRMTASGFGGGACIEADGALLTVSGRELPNGEPWWLVTRRTDVGDNPGALSDTALDIIVGQTERQWQRVLRRKGLA